MRSPESTTMHDPAQDTWSRFVHCEEVWGGVIVIDVRGPHLPSSLESAVAEAVDFFHQVDRWFSTYRMDSVINSLRMGFAEAAQMPAPVVEVLRRCDNLRALTGGVFDPWAVEGGVDPSGFVKGWAADIAADMLVAAGCDNVSVNAAGDIAVRGHQSEGQPWVFGIRHPDDANAVAATFELSHGSVATSGEYERGKHIINPFTGAFDTSLRSATVVGIDGGTADALATALLIAGLPGVAWFANFPNWSAYLIDDNGVHFFGPAFDALQAAEVA